MRTCVFHNMKVKLIYPHKKYQVTSEFVFIITTKTMLFIVVL